MEEKNDVIVLDGNNVMKEYTDYQRVNFDIPSTIISYGNDILAEIGELMQNLSNMMRKDDAMDPVMDEKIDAISSFSDYLQDTEEQKNKYAMTVAKRANAKGLEAFVNKVFKKNEEKEAEAHVMSYYDQYQKYKRDIELVAESIELREKNTYVDMKVNEAFIKNLETLIQKLDVLVKVGKEDLQTYIDTVIKPLEEEYGKNPTNDLNNEIIVKRKLAELFSRRLLDLEKNLTLNKNTKLQTVVEQGPNFELLIEYQSFNTTVVPALLVQAKAMVSSIRQKEALSTHKKTVDAVNNVISSNAKLLVENIQASNDLAMEGNIRLQTLEDMEGYIKQGIELYKQGRIQAKDHREKSVSILKQMSEDLEALQTEMMGEAPLGITEAFVKKTDSSISDGFSRKMRKK